MQLHCKVNAGVMLNYFRSGKSCPKQPKNMHLDDHKIGAVRLKVAKIGIDYQTLNANVMQLHSFCSAFGIQRKEKERKVYIHIYPH